MLSTSTSAAAVAKQQQQKQQQAGLKRAPAIEIIIIALIIFVRRELKNVFLIEPMHSGLNGSCWELPQLSIEIESLNVITFEIRSNNLISNSAINILFI